MKVSETAKITLKNDNLYYNMEGCDLISSFQEHISGYGKEDLNAKAVDYSSLQMHPSAK